MTSISNTLPHEGEQVFLTDGGLETTLIFHEGVELPHFAAVTLLESARGTGTLRQYYRRYADIAVEAELGFVLESPTWRASRDWGDRLGYDEDRLTALNRVAVELMCEIRDQYQGSELPFVVSGNVGPRGDGYVMGEKMTVDEAKNYHREQIATMAAAGADLITALTLTYPEEAIGIANAAAEVSLPAVIGFTTETDGRLPNGDTLEDAIGFVDVAADIEPAYYMINCAHVDHFSDSLNETAGWSRRIRGIRANASRLSHAELDECEQLDDGDPEEFGQLYSRLRARFPQLTVLGGCCGTDHRHVGACTNAVW